MNKRLFEIAFLLMILFLPGAGKGQSSLEEPKTMADLYKIISVSENDCLKVRTHLHLFDSLRTEYPDSAYSHMREAVRMVEEDRDIDPTTRGDVYFFNGDILYSRSEPEKAVRSYHNAIRIYGEGGDLKYVAQTQISIGYVKIKTGDLPGALDVLVKAHKLSDSLGYDHGAATSGMNIGNILFYQGRKGQALKYYKETYRLRKDHPKRLPGLLNNIGSIHFKKGDLDSARHYFQKALSISREVGVKKKEAMSLSNLSSYYNKTGDHLKALEYQKKATAIRKNSLGHSDLALSYMNIAAPLTDLGRYQEALQYLDSALFLSREKKNLQTQMDSYFYQYQVFEKMGEHEKAYSKYLDYRTMKDSILNNEKQENISNLEAEFQDQKRDLELEKLRKKEELQTAAREKQRIWIYASSGGGAILLILAFQIIRGYIRKKRHNQLLEEKHELISDQKKLLEVKNKEIMESIRYGKDLQSGFLPNEKAFLPPGTDRAILFKPRDEVSGDIYWMDSRSHGSEGNLHFFSVMDCTGHGVPGAFVSIVGFQGLEKIVGERGLTSPGKILKELDRHIRESLEGSRNEPVKDGMDMAFCVFHESTKELVLCGANNPVYIVTNEKRELESDRSLSKNGYTLHEFKGERSGVGGELMEKTYTDRTVELKAGDRVFMFSDGYADQFGGPNGKKFKYKPFKESILDTMERSLDQQMQALDSILEGWMEDQEQVDDICIMSFTPGEEDSS